MLCTDRFLAVSQPKTGSATRRWSFNRILGGTTCLVHDGVRYRDHCPLRDIPPEALGERLTVATVRNPWDWYVSAWRHVMVNKRMAVHPHLAALGRGSQEWEAVLYGMTHPEEVPGRLASHVILRPGGLEGEGVWSRSTLWFNSGAVAWVDLAAQNEVWADLAPEHADALRSCAWENVTEGALSSTWHWTGEQIEWVRQADAEYIDLFGFVGPGSTARKPLFHGSLL